MLECARGGEDSVPPSGCERGRRGQAVEDEQVGSGRRRGESE
jgi:hypothetical protein